MIFIVVYSQDFNFIYIGRAVFVNPSGKSYGTKEGLTHMLDFFKDSSFKLISTQTN